MLLTHLKEMNSLYQVIKIETLKNFQISVLYVISLFASRDFKSLGHRLPPTHIVTSKA